MILGLFVAIIEAIITLAIKVIVLIILILFIQIAWPKYKEYRAKEREKEWWKPKDKK